MKKWSYDAVVVGGGIAGVNSARELARSGFTVALIERQNSESPNDKSLFVDGAKLPASVLALGNFHPIPNHRLVNADRPNDGWGKLNTDVRTGVIDYLPVIRTLSDNLPPCIDKIQARYISSEEDDHRVVVHFKHRVEQRIITRYLIDASGDASTVSRNHSTSTFKSLISDDPLVAWMFGARAVGQFDPHTVYDPIGKDIGGTSWLTPLSHSRGDVIASGVSRLSEVRLSSRKPTLNNLIKFCEVSGICHVERIERHLVGIIRSEPISLRDVRKSNRVWQIGQAAGMADPLMAEAFSPAYLLPSVMVKFLSSGRTTADFYNYWRFSNSMFNYDLMLAMLRRRYSYHERGVVGSSSALYKTLTEHMSHEAMHRALSERRVPLSDLQVIASRMLRDKVLRTTATEVLIAYAKIVLTKKILRRFQL
jgi:flavin-dependent dehydrogenase